MGKFDGIERRVWQMATGSSHPHYRQALWRPTRQEVSSVALSEPFTGNAEASNWNRRSWQKLGIIAIRPGSLERILSQPNVDPAIAFAIGDRLAVGRVAAPEDFGWVESSVGINRGHGMRVGPGELQFTIGGVTESGEFLTPSAEDLLTVGMSHVALVGDDQDRYGAMNFS
ncbi:MAG TPA: hypothetical protein VFT16_03905 [Candidatus Saccharimonadales bacterium]|nr:hypothetical protein [Candidatus Saccharimonadales bacterium]